MADLHKGLTLLATEPKRRRATIVYGPPALTERFVKAWRGPMATVDYLDVYKGSEGPLWDVLGQVRLDTQPHGIIVRGAQHLDDSHAARLHAWSTDRGIRDTYALFVADFEKWPSSRSSSSGWTNTNPALREVFVNNRKSSLLVEAAVPDTEIGHTHAAQIVRAIHPALGWTGSRDVLAHTQWDLNTAMEAAQKAKIVGTANIAHVKILSAHEAKTQFIEALAACDKPSAALSAADVPHEAYGATITRLDYALDILARIHRAQKFNESTNALATRLAVNRTVIARYRPHARHYTSKDVARRTRALVWADDAVRKGRRAGVLEMLSVQW